MCSIAEIDDPNDGESIEEKTFARCKKEGEVFDKYAFRRITLERMKPFRVTSTAIKMVLGNIKQLKVEYTDVVVRFLNREKYTINSATGN